MKPARDRVLAFFKAPGCRIAISRETLSRCCEVDFAELDAALEALAGEGLLERAPFLDQWRPVRGFTYDAPPSYLRVRERQIVRQAEAARKHAADVERTEARREALAKQRAENTAKALATKRVTREARELRRAEEAARKRADKATLKAARNAVAEERLRAFLAAKVERARKRAEADDAKIARYADKRRLVDEALARKANAAADAETVKMFEALKPRAKSAPIRPSAVAPIFVKAPPPRVVAAPPRRAPAAPDPYALIRARAAAKPAYLGSDLRKPTDREKMTGRIERRA